ncbi:phosphatidylglycerophosphatase A [Mucilaginibacter corticis]|uniref:Phosphatidylglycerophosphatase A n=1 Tax=Mucilaginibacter corticis TaxID=2597670 RepID=A0A556MHD3_9SPHI|nr:phosphatidylglycerophosphatase A [Mucilaginibacter corticis]TSJ39308.1 phosphatidylglycerophosphatase A [Mucilaginibacter corticis]
MLFHKLAATVFGIGYLGKGVGTIAAFFACVCWYLLWHNNAMIMPAILLTAIVTALGIWSGNKVEPIWGKDHNRVVIDEVAGMFVSLLFVPVTLPYITAGFILFRFFDILKPLFIRRLEALPGGWGVMADDLLAGVYANIILQLIVWLNILNVRF